MHAHYTAANTVGRAPMGCRSGHSVAGERRFYTGTGDALTIDGEWDIIVVPEAPRDENGQKERLAPADLQLHREGEPNVPLTELVDDDSEQSTVNDEEMDEYLTSSLDDRGPKAATIDAAVSEFENDHRDRT